jgi:hypothetical protein
MSRPAFWLTLVLMVTVIFAKDAYVIGLDRNFNFKAYHILQEAEAFEKVTRSPLWNSILGALGLAKKSKKGSNKTAPFPQGSKMETIDREYESVVL